MFQRNPEHSAKSPYKGPAVGVLHWSYRFVWGHTEAAPSIDGNGRIYTAGGGHEGFTMELHKMYCMNTSGAMAWSYAMPYNPTAAFIDSAPAISSEGNVHFGCNGGSSYSFLFALDPSGGLQWSYRTADGIYSSSNLGANGEIYFQTRQQQEPYLDQNIYALNPNGTLGWSYWKGGLAFESGSLGRGRRHRDGRDVSVQFERIAPVELWRGGRQPLAVIR